jgi:hypothetical protein
MSQGFPGQNPPGSGIPNPYGGGGTTPYGQTSQPYTPPGYGPFDPTQPPKKDRTGCIVASIVGGILGVFVLMCASCLGLGLFAINQEGKETARQLSVDYRNHPKVIEEVGEVQEVTFNMSDTMFSEDADSIEIFDVRGDKGTAQFVVEKDFDQEILSVTLRNGRGEWMLDDEADHMHDDDF